LLTLLGELPLLVALPRDRLTELVELHLLADGDAGAQ
jgi:hypothetical protein